MPRLGDLLVQAGRVTPADVEDAARAQVAYGGRIGTNLVELSHLEIDELAVFLGRQHRLPPAQRHHFDVADTAIQAMLPAEVATRLGVIPIARVATAPHKIAVASLGPLAPDALEEIAVTLHCAPGDLVIGVAAELRILYNLERVYSVPRPSRFLRTRRGGTQEIAIAPLPREAGDDAAVPEPVEDAPTVPVPDEVLLELVADEGAQAEEPATAERRRFVSTLDEGEPRKITPAGGISSLGRINLRKLTIAAAVEGTIGGGATLADCLRAIKRCRDRENIGALAIDCLERASAEILDAGVLFVARGPVAIGWHGFSRDAEVDFDQLALPLDQPGVVAREPGAAIRRIAPGAGEITPLDERLIAALGFDPPTFAIAAPIAIRDHVIGFVYGQGRGDRAVGEALVVDVAEATRAALTSLLRAAQR